MALSVQKGTVTAPTGVGATNVVSLDASKFSVANPCRALVIWGTFGATNTATDGDARMSKGYVTRNGGAIAQTYVTGFDADTLGTSASSQGINSGFCMKGYATATTMDYTAAVTAFSDTGFTLTWADPPAVAFEVHFMAIGGADCTGAHCGVYTPTLTATQDIALPAGFGQPNVVMFNFADRPDAVADFKNDLTLVFGWDNVTSKSAIYYGAYTAAALMNLYGQTRSDGSWVTSARQASLAARNVWSTDSFRMTYSATNDRASPTTFLALTGPFTSTIGQGVAPIAGTPPVVQDIAHTAATTPKGAFVMGTPLIHAANDTTSVDLGGIWFGGTDGVNEGTAGIVNDDNNTTSFAGVWTNATKVIQNRISPGVAGAPTLMAEADGLISGTNLRLSWNDTDTTARAYYYLILGDAVPVPTLTLPTFQGAY